MDKILTEESISDKYIFAFTGFHEYHDFTKIMEIIKEIIKPDRCKYRNLGKDGFFVKDELIIDVEYVTSDFALVLNGDKTESDIVKVREWAKVIFNKLANYKLSIETIFENYWMQIIKIGEKYIIKYNTGDLICSIDEIEVTKRDAMQALENDQNAYNIIIKYQNIRMFGQER